MFQPLRSRPVPAQRARPVFAPPEAALARPMQAVTELLAAAVRPTTTTAIAEPVLAFAGPDGLDALAALDAATGAASCGPLEAVRGTLELLLAAQRADGRLPSRL